MFDQITLPNGLRVVGEKLGHIHSCTVGVWVKVGSVTELPEENGLSHFIEHMVFKGTKNRTARQIAEEMETADQIIAERLGRRPRYFAYPYGFHDVAAREEAERRYRASFTTRLADLSSGDDAAQLPRLDSHYLRHPWLIRRLNHASGRGYIGLRHLIRQIRNRS